jgi:hypothetical protein
MRAVIAHAAALLVADVDAVAIEKTVPSSAETASLITVPSSAETASLITVPSSAETASLIVLIGLFREFERGTNSVKRNLIEANPHTAFDVALFTDDSVCSSKDVETGRCSCTDAVNASVINSTATAQYGSRLIHMQVAHASSMGSRWQQSWPTIRALAASRQYLIVLRPDVELVAPIDAPHTCERHPGFNIISGDFERDYVFHKRDIDFGYLACSAAAANLKWDAADEEATCCTSPPSLPTGFTGSWNACEGLACNTDVDCQVT